MLGLNERSSTSQREAKVLKRLKKTDLAQEAYCLNDIFNLNFKVPLDYENLNNKLKYRKLKKVFEQFCQNVRNVLIFDIFESWYFTGF